MTAALPEYPYDSDGVVAREGDLVVLDCRGTHLCGYCAFPDDDLPESWRGNYDAPGLQFLAIHGGLTYANTGGGYSVFGFDCAHAGDDEKPELRNPEHVMGLARQMRQQIVAFRERRTEWLAADREGKAAIIDSIREQAANPVEFGFGGMIEMLAGAPSLGEGA